MSIPAPRWRFGAAKDTRGARTHVALRWDITFASCARAPNPATTDLKKRPRRFYARVKAQAATVVGVYVNCNTRVECRCQHGHKCEPMPTSVQQGGGICSTCSQSVGERMVSELLRELRPRCKPQWKLPEHRRVVVASTSGMTALLSNSTGSSISSTYRTSRIKAGTPRLRRDERSISRRRGCVVRGR